MTTAVVKKARLERVIVFPDNTEHNMKPLEEYVDRHFSAEEVHQNVEYLFGLLKDSEKQRLLDWAEVINGSPHEPCRPIMLLITHAVLVIYRGNSVEYVLQKIKTRGTCSGILLP